MKKKSFCFTFIHDGQLKSSKSKEKLSVVDIIIDINNNFRHLFYAL